MKKWSTAVYIWVVSESAAAEDVELCATRPTIEKIWKKEMYVFKVVVVRRSLSKEMTSAIIMTTITTPTADNIAVTKTPEHSGIDLKI